MSKRAHRPSTGSAPWAASLLAMTAPVAKSGYRNSLFWRVYDTVAEKIDRKRGWDSLPVALGILALVGLRNVLRKTNLYDTSGLPAIHQPKPGPPAAGYATTRTVDGSYNDLDQPCMGMAGSRFGRNVPLERTHREPEPMLLSPNPRVVSRRLLTRHEFQPASTLNVLAAAWLQFMIRDWFSHGRGLKDDPWQLALDADDDWPTPPLSIPRVPPDPTRPDGASGPPTYLNINSHWWDASSIYGNDAERQRAVRSGVDGKLRVGPDGAVPISKDPAKDPAQEPGFWVGLVLLGALFSLEHNAICDRLKSEHPQFGDEELFQRARLITAALIAKIHTVEWTPAILSHPTTVVALRANWWGVATQRVYRLFGRISANEVISGIPGSQTNHYGIPYALTEEFVAVYRMHPLIRDDYSLRAVADDAPIRDATLRDLAGPAALDVFRQIGLGDLLYSFGTEHPGAIILRNFPRFLQEFQRPDGKLMDLAATDILRSRELGVPRYNEFRRLLHLAPARDFESLTDDAELAATIREVYAGDIERVDLTVGMFAEKRPRGFAFSETAFRIFILMASRRLNSDRFFTTDYTAEVYTQAGLDWIEHNTMVTVLLRHSPQLRPALRGIDNAFWPWHRAST